MKKNESFADLQKKFLNFSKISLQKEIFCIKNICYFLKKNYIIHDLRRVVNLLFNYKNMRKINIFLLMCVIFGMTFLSVSASNYVYLNTQTIQRLDNDLKNYRGDKEVYINSMISRINTMIQKETSVTQRRVLIELRAYYQTQKNDLTNVDRVVDELFGTRVEYTPTYNTPDIPVAFSPVIRTQGTSSSVVELRW